MPKKKAPSDFLVTLTTGDLTYSSEGSSIMDALAKLDPKVFKAKGTLKVQYGVKKAELFMRPLWMRRLGVNKTMRQVTEKKLLTLLK